MNGLIARALQTGEKLEIIYCASDGTISQRMIKVVEERENHLLAFCYSRGQVRTFQKDSILSIFPAQFNKRGVSHEVS
ncbi:hypothetical protein LF817_01235 [Halobacillus sp. A1]|uniref:WYL domain-containing protein n=1 Tax=Halobacillus sp. A1 TaxID=2880262 RepID=UPI0020A69494|nr:hypothetical protein [Halobacillus sp. A1]MCP3029955.1 hypothetical protein [Halobacillus sp. A1]